MFQGLDHLLGNAYFGLFAIAALLCACGLLFSKHPLNATIYLIGVMLSISGIYALLSSPFLGVVQVLVYAGAIMRCRSSTSGRSLRRSCPWCF